jgi:hypothetical protein
VAVCDFPVPVCHVCGCTAISLKDHRLANAACRISQTANTFHTSVAREGTGNSRPMNREVPKFVGEGLLEGLMVEDDGFEGVDDMPEEQDYNQINGEDPDLSRTTVEEDDAVSQRTLTPLRERVGAVP